MKHIYRKSKKNDKSINKQGTWHYLSLFGEGEEGRRWKFFLGRISLFPGGNEGRSVIANRVWGRTIGNWLPMMGTGEGSFKITEPKRGGGGSCIGPGRSGLMVSALNSGLSGLGSRPGRVIVLRSWEKHFKCLSPPRSINGYCPPPPRNINGYCFPPPRSIFWYKRVNKDAWWNAGGVTI